MTEQDNKDAIRYKLLRQRKDAFYSMIKGYLKDEISMLLPLYYGNLSVIRGRDYNKYVVGAEYGHITLSEIDGPGKIGLEIEIDLEMYFHILDELYSGRVEQLYMCQK